MMVSYMESALWDHYLYLLLRFFLLESFFYYFLVFFVKSCKQIYMIFTQEKINFSIFLILECFNHFVHFIFASFSEKPV